MEGLEEMSELFPVKDHLQNFFYVIVDPVNWGVTLFYNKWKAYW